jgi:2-polyprenyl-6-methoxyphenol hydroxylase-like FAD-dependent oxidoreductase
VILIVGGGIGGLSLAACLATRGIACELVEREPQWTTTGGGITLYPNGMRALGTIDVGDAVEAAGAVLHRFRVVSRDGQLVSEVRGDAWDGVGRTVLVNRRALQDVLRGAAGAVPTRLGVTVTRIHLGPAGAEVAFSDGVERSYELVVGADGIRSSVRALVFGEVEARYVGQVYWRAAARVDLVDCPTMMFDTDRFVVVFPLGDGTTYLAWQLRTDEPLGGPAGGTAQSLYARFGDFAEPCRAAIDCVAGGGPVHFGPAEEIDSDHWRAGRVVLIGDAAHACSPTMAQGGSLAIEDAVVLGEELAGAADVPSALDAFVARRLPRVRWVRARTHAEITALNRGAGHLTERSGSIREVLSQPI